MYDNSYVMHVISPLSMPGLKMYIYIRDTFLLLNVYNSNKTALLQLKARNKIYKGANRSGGERECGRNDTGTNGKVDETIRG